MENEKGEILYIGKAKNLAKRVISYSNISNLSENIQRYAKDTKLHRLSVNMENPTSLLFSNFWTSKGTQTILVLYPKLMYDHSFWS